MAGWKRKQPEQISCFWSQALWYLAAALIEPLKFLSPHAGSAGWLTKHFFLRQKLCLFSLPLCESVTLCRSWSICLMNRRWISLSWSRMLHWGGSTIGELKCKPGWQVLLECGGLFTFHVIWNWKVLMQNTLAFLSRVQILQLRESNCNISTNIRYKAIRINFPPFPTCDTELACIVPCSKPTW